MPYEAWLRLASVESDALRFTARDAEGHEIVVDSGDGAVGPSPMQLLLISLGGCTAMDVISILRKQRQTVTGYEVEVRAERGAEYPRIFTRIEVVHRVRGRGLDPAGIARAIELSDTKYCSVHAMLAASVHVTSRFQVESEEVRAPTK